MEPLTHFFTGACMGRAGLNRKTPYATLAATLAAEAADLDVFWGLRGPVEGLKHHRGITHTFVGVPVVAAAIVGLVCLLHRWLERRRARKREAARLTPGEPVPRRLQPRTVHWGWLSLTAFLAALSHIALDWTNNYGIRPLSLQSHWYSGDLVFIAEPVLWALFYWLWSCPSYFD
jgi:inner membrane protein